MAAPRSIFSLMLSTNTQRFAVQRCLFATASVDPVKKLFVDKLNEVKKGKKIPVTPEAEKRLKDEQERLRRVFGGDNLEEFPKLEFGSQ